METLEIINIILFVIVIIVIAIILYFLFIKRQTTIGSSPTPITSTTSSTLITPPTLPTTTPTFITTSLPCPDCFVTLWNNCSLPVIATVYYPPSSGYTTTQYLLQGFLTEVTAAYVQGMYITFTSQSGENLGTVYPTPRQIVQPPKCPQFPPSSAVVIPSATIVNSCSTTVIATVYYPPSSGFTNWTFPLTPQQLLTIQYTPGVYVTITSTTGQYLETITPLPGQILNITKCP